MTPALALTAVIAQLNAAGLKQVRSPSGVSQVSNNRANRCFSVAAGSIRPATKPSRGQPNAVGLRMTHTFRIEMGHRLKPADGLEAPSQALEDLHAVYKQLSATGTTLTTDGAIIIGTATNTITGSGAYLVTAFDLAVTYNLALV